MTRLRREEGGWALVTAIILMGVMVSIGLATFALVDGQTNQSRVSRMRETAFNYAEAALNAQIFALSREWAGKGLQNNPYTTCTQASVSTRCPDATRLTAMFPTPDATPNVTWQTMVRDNNASGGANFYSDALTVNAPGWDANNDGKLWVRAEAQARGRKRTLIALVKMEEWQEDMPRAALLTGRLTIDNMGSKLMINSKNGTAQSGVVAVRCTPEQREEVACLGHRLDNSFGKSYTQAWNELQDLLDYQIVPNNTTTGYNAAPSLDADALDRLRRTAIANGTYYATCPTADPPPSGKVVFIETGNCAYQSTGVVNSPTSPGSYILASATLKLSGTLEFYGVIYGANLQNTSGFVVDIQGNAMVKGGVIVDGTGMTSVGSSKDNITFDDKAFNSVQSYGMAGIIQNTWREIKNS